jgi:type II pantothenate kinase
MASLTQLADPDHYRPCDWDLQTDAQGRAYWDALFRWHLDDVLVPLIQAEYGPTREQLADFRRAYLAVFDELQAHPERYGRVDILLFTELRRRVSAEYGFHDPFRGLKQREDETALKLLPGVLAELDAAAPPTRRELLVDGLMAGNLFDLGSKATVRSHEEGSAAFRESRARQAERRWLRNDAPAWWRRWEEGPAFRHVLFFVDNAGSDVVLGCLPLARWMVQAGARVTLAANTSPALNDITAAELAPLVERCAGLDPFLATAAHDGRLGVAPTGSRLPLLDLTQLSEGFVRTTRDADLIILHGMGRAVESNFHARFCCDAVSVALLKDEAVAARLNGALLDCVFRYVPGST